MIRPTNPSFLTNQVCWFADHGPWASLLSFRCCLATCDLMPLGAVALLRGSAGPCQPSHPQSALATRPIIT